MFLTPNNFFIIFTYALEQPLRRKKIPKKISLTKKHFIWPKWVGVWKGIFFENIASKASEKFSNFRK